jgi:hypothetical protein
VHGSAGPAVSSVRPEIVNAPLQVLQSTRVESRPLARFKV